MIVRGGFDGSSYLNTGGRYNPSTDNWVAASTTNAPQARTGHTAVWTGSEMIIWGGYNGSQQVNTGGRYCAVVPTPTPTATVTPTPTATATATATATGNGYTERNTNCNCDGIFYTYGDTYVDAETYSHTEASSEAGVAPVTLALVRSSASPRGALETRSFAGLKKPPRVIKPKRTARGWSRV